MSLRNDERFLNQPSGWFHVVFNLIGLNDGEGIAIYHDGILQERDTTRETRSKSASNGTVVIGRTLVDVDDNYGSVELDELYFFNEWLSDNEIRIMYNSGSIGTPNV